MGPLLMPATTAKPRPLILRPWEVAATLAGRKTQLRRAVKDGDHYGCLTGDCPHDSWAECQKAMAEFCPLGRAGEQHWIKEPWAVPYCNGKPRPHMAVEYEATPVVNGRRWRSPALMPRWASRLTVENTFVRVEKLGDISEADCWAEGIDEVDGMFDNDAAIGTMAKRLGCCIDDAKPTFAVLWESMYGPGSWDPQKWVWVVGYKQVEGQ